MRIVNKGKDVSVSISARKLAAGLWRLQLPEAPSTVGDRLSNEQLGLQVFFLLLLTVPLIGFIFLLTCNLFNV